MVNDVSDTAFAIAHYRALETARADALFRDPLAGLLAGERGKAIANAMPMPTMAGQIVVIRTAIIDDYIQFAVSEGVDTILNLGAGLDTRPYRLDLPESLAWIEADYPHIIAFKEKHLASETPRCRLERAKLDLADLSERRTMFASVNARANKMLILTEGVVSYLSVDEAGSLADDLRSLDHARYWIVEYISPELIKYRQRGSMGRKMRNAPFKFKPTDWAGFFGGHGWRAQEIRYLADEGERLHRPIELPVFLKITVKLRTLFSSNDRREGFRRFQGYAMLEPGS